MNESKRLLAVFGVIVGFILIILLISFWPKPDKSFSCGVKGDKDYKKLGSVNYEQYQCLMKLDTNVALVVDEKLSAKEKDALNVVAEDINHAIYYLDFENVSKSELKTIKKQLKYSEKSFDKDVILVVKKGKVKAYKEEILSDAEELAKFADKNDLAKFTCGVKSDAEYENLGEINYEQYQCLVKKDETFAVIVAQTTCGYCQQFKPVIDEYVKDNNLRIYIMEIDQWSDEEKDAFTSSLDYFKNNESWGTPLTLAINGDKVLSELSGYTNDEDEIAEFFKEAKLK